MATQDLQVAAACPYPDSQSPKKLLIVDDDECNCEILKEVLVSKGYSVDFITTGEAALDLIFKSPQLPHLIIVDSKLPGMAGSEFVQQLKEISVECRNIPIILSSADTMVSNKNNLFSARLTKPIDFSVLFSAIEKLLKN